MVAEENDVPVETAATNVETAREVVPEIIPDATPEEEELVTRVVENAPEATNAEEVINKTVVEFAAEMVGLDEDDNAEEIQEIFNSWGVATDSLVNAGDVNRRRGEERGLVDDQGNLRALRPGEEGYEKNAAWCAAFVAAVLRDTGHQDVLDGLRTDNLPNAPQDSPVPSRRRRDQGGYTFIRALNFAEVGEAVPGSAEGTIGDAKPGDIVVIQHKRGDGKIQYHVSFYVGKEDDGTLLLLGGNQQDKVQVSKYNPDGILAVRRPFESSPTEAERNEASAAALGVGSSGGADR